MKGRGGWPGRDWAIVAWEAGVAYVELARTRPVPGIGTVVREVWVSCDGKSWEEFVGKKRNPRMSRVALWRLKRRARARFIELGLDLADIEA